MNWSGDLTGTATTQFVSMNAAKSVAASFGRPFADPALIPGTSIIRLVHITDLRTRIDAARVVAGLSPFAWADPGLAAGDFVRAQHILDLRTALAEVYVQRTLTPPTYTDPGLGPGTTMKAAHINELRAAVIAVE